MFVETRGNDGKKPKEVDFKKAILDPNASYGGLYTLKKIDHFESNFLEKSIELSYKELVKKVFNHLELKLDNDILDNALKMYESFDDPNNPALLNKLEKIGNKLFCLELYHGPTRAFKDMALAPFGSLLSSLAKQENKKYLILVATSGDTGPATLDTFKNKENIKVFCIYPHGGTSDVQRLQMTTNRANNLKVVGINGDFDDAQNALKMMLKDTTFLEALKNRNYELSVANSVNFGRIAFQIIYHIWSYLRLLATNEIKLGDKINIIVPSGNFGNTLGAFYARELGVPIKKIVVASNQNNVLTSFINNGSYDLRDKKLQKSLSPAMDILKSSNVERLLYHLFGESRTRELMESLESRLFFELSVDETNRLKSIFSACYCNDEYVKNKIKELSSSGYIIDPHTATAFKAFDELVDKNEINIICSTAEWTKFAPTLLKALENRDGSDKEALEFISKKFGINIHNSIKSLFETNEYHKEVIDKDKIANEVLKFVS